MEFASTLKKGKQSSQSNLMSVIVRRLQLQMGIQTLLNSSKPEDFEELLFWGKVNGTQNDYYVCMGVNYKSQYEFPTKTFYWATSKDFKFKQFRSLNTQHKDKYDGIEGGFRGNGSHVYITVEGHREEGEAPPEEEKEEKERDPLASSSEEDPNKDFVPRNLTEEDRLLYTVHAIENDCSIVPHGAFRMTEAHEVERNAAFRGLNCNDCFELNKYSHFRNCQDPEKKELLLKDDAVFQPDFLDEVSSDVPKGIWSDQKDSNGKCAVIRNHMWAGYTAYHASGTNCFGGVYVGDGLKNADLAFMI